MKIDLHSHTTCSDGTLSPGELVAAAARAGIQVLAVTDHDTVAGLEEAIEAGRTHSIRVIPGIELSTVFEDEEIHLLGLGIDPLAPEFRQQLENLKSARIHRIEEICRRLLTMDILISPHEIHGHVLGHASRKDVARLLVEKGHARSTRHAFHKFLGMRGPAYVPSVELTTAQGISLLRQHQAVPVLAHPGLLDDEASIVPIASEGLMGLEVYHQYANGGVCENMLELARRYRLLVSGGSDYHGGRVGPTYAPLGKMTCPEPEFRTLDGAIQFRT
jgi:predicted metal-dependent phosphoesterase TrpH